MNKLFTLFLCSLFSICFGQISDDFSDGDLTKNPKWQGEVNDFRVGVEGLLNLDTKPVTSFKTIFTASNVGDTASWSFDVFLGFNTSSANYVVLWLTAKDSLFSSTDGLYLRLGGTGDNIQIWQKSEGNETLVLESANGIFDSDSTAMHIEIKRTGAEIRIDTGFGITNTLAITTHSFSETNGRFFALQPHYTATRFNKFWFDNILVTGNKEHIKPKVVTQKCLNEHAIELSFSEPIDPSSVNLSNFLVNGTVVPDSSYVKNQHIEFFFDASLPLNNYLSIQVKNLTDEIGNKLIDTSVFVFCGIPELPQKGDIVINEMMIDPSPNPHLPEVEYLELYNASEKAIALSSFQIFNSHTEFLFLRDTILLPKRYYTVLDASSVTQFRNAGVDNLIATNSFTSLNNTSDSLSILANNIVVDIVSYNTVRFSDPKANGGFSLERIDVLSRCDDPFNFIYSNAERQGSPSAMNSVANITPSVFEVLSTYANSDETVTLQFSQSLNLTEITAPSFNLDGAKMERILRGTETEYTFHLSFNSWPEENTTVALELFNIQSCVGSVLDTSLSILIPKNSIGNELHITELMVDPSPSQGLPNAEYLEIFNSASYPILLSDFTMIKKGQHYQIPNHSLGNNEYLLVISDEDSADFDGYEFIALKSFPSLINTADSISISHLKTGQTETINYNINFYHDAVRSSGGFSLEAIRPEENCLGKLNFTASNSPSGGTPGYANSVHQTDTTNSLPVVDELLHKAGTLHIVFDRSVSLGPEFEFNSVSFSPEMPYVVNGLQFDSLTLGIFPDEAVFEYDFSIKDISDCRGNTTDTTLLLVLGKEPAKGDLKITEIMPDPSPNISLPETEYLEFYNPLSTPVVLNSLALNGIFLDLNYVLPPNEYVIVTHDTTGFGIKNSITSDKLSSSFLSNSGKQLTLSNVNSGEIITRLDYSSKWHTNVFARDGGISLELSHNNVKCYNSPLFWKNSEDKLGGTPGKKNSIQSTITANVEHALDFYKNSLLSFSFNGPIELDSLSYDFPIDIDSLFLSRNEQIIHFKTAQSLPESGVYSIALKECNTPALVEYSTHINLPSAPKKADIVLNEILFDAEADKPEFVEIINLSDKTLTLNNLRYSIDGNHGVVDSLGLILYPKSLIILASDSSKLYEYQHHNALVWYPYCDLPSLPNTGLDITLLSSVSDTIDHATVNNDYHYPLLNSTKGVALERVKGQQLENELFVSAPENIGWASPGLNNAHKTTPIENGVNLVLSDNYISANGDGFQDFIEIVYTNHSVQSISITVYDRAGFKIKEIASNAIHSGTTSFLWNGENDDKQITEAGLYILVLDVTDNGNNENRIKKLVTVSR